MRAFVSVGFDGLETRIEAVQNEFAGAGGLGFVSPRQVHVTLAFLGDASGRERPAVIEAIERAIGESGISPFEAVFGGLGVSPGREYIGVLWIGVCEGDERLVRLHGRLESEPSEIERGAETQV